MACLVNSKVCNVERDLTSQIGNLTNITMNKTIQNKGKEVCYWTIESKLKLENLKIELMFTRIENIKLNFYFGTSL